ncbi:S24 family peptidase [Flavobacterium sp. CAU 1735]|uniref:LexA family transcriptional regulator n=1 Tax=Flavobacterium sp. CAU 1735 TaxID=3140361 RepID=UPI0032602AC7
MKPIERVKEIIRYYGLSISGFEKKIHMSNNSIQTAIKRTASLKDDTLNNILKAFPDISPEWLLMGNGKMFRKDNLYNNSDPNAITNENNNSYPLPHSDASFDSISLKNAALIPLITETAFSKIKYKAFIASEHILEKYHIPTFKDVDFLVSVKGNAMLPKYNSGDMIACKRIPLDSFLQWNHIYIISTTQGILIKRVLEGKDDDHILAVSENPEFLPFQLHRKEINAMAIAVGVIHIE